MLGPSSRCGHGGHIRVPHAVRRPRAVPLMCHVGLQPLCLPRCQPSSFPPQASTPNLGFSALPTLSNCLFCNRHVVRAIWGSLIVWHSVSLCCGGHGLVVACCLFPALTRQKYHRGAYALAKRGCLPARPVRLLHRGPVVESLWRCVCRVCSLACYILKRSQGPGPQGRCLASGALMR